MLNIIWISFVWIKSAVSPENIRILISFIAFTKSLPYIIKKKCPALNLPGLHNQLLWYMMMYYCRRHTAYGYLNSFERIGEASLLLNSALIHTIVWDDSLYEMLSLSMSKLWSPLYQHHFTPSIISINADVIIMSGFLGNQPDTDIVTHVVEKASSCMWMILSQILLKQLKDLWVDRYPQIYFPTA